MNAAIFHRRCVFFVALISIAIAVLLISRENLYAWEGKVVGIVDGDTLEIFNYRESPVKIHFYGVQSPGIKHFFGDIAMSYCSEMLLERNVEVINIGYDHLGRMRSIIYIDGTCANEEMVRAGLAWVSNPHGLSPSCKRWLVTERDARNSRCGLWDALSRCLAEGFQPDLPRNFPIKKMM